MGSAVAGDGAGDQEYPLSPAQRRGIRAHLRELAERPIQVLGQEPVGHRWAPVTRLHLSQSVAELGTSVIVKTVRTTGPGHGGPPYLRREAAGLIIAEGSGAVARLIAVDHEQGWALMTDLGRLPTLHERLTTGPANAAETAMAELGTALGRLHAITAGRRHDHERAAGGSPADLRTGVGYGTGLTAWTRLARSAADLGAPPPSAVGAEAQRLIDRIRNPGAGGALVHRDLNPTNVLLATDGARIVDFESSWFGHPGIDLSFLHYPFPHFSTPWAVLPRSVVQRTDAAYRSALAHGGAHRLLDRYDQILADGAGHVLITRLSRLPLIDRTDQSAADARRRRGQTLDQIATCLPLLSRAAGFDHLTEWLPRLHSVLTQRWPDVAELDSPRWAAFD